MDKFIKEKNKVNIKLVGNKAYNLAILEKHGINVPKWFAIPSKCTGEDLENLEEEINAYIKQNFDEKDLFSVRSSGVGEDGEEFSYAGEFDTFLNVKGSNIITNIKKCWESKYSDRVKSYNKDFANINMGVVVQKMINPDCSGVLFTANPTGILNEMVIVKGRGQGINVVDDKVPVCTYYYNKTDDIFYYEKQKGAKELEKGELNNLIEIGNKIFDIYKKHMDIEWCIKDDILYILQARPITTLNTKNITVLDNSNIVESYPNITLPLTQSYIKESYYRVFKNVFSRLVKDEKIINNNEKNLKEMLGIANGRVYYKINNWYSFIVILPFSKKVIPIWQEMLGVLDKEVITNSQKISTITKINVFFNSIYLMITVDKKMKKLNRDFLEVSKYFSNNFKSVMTNEELMKLYDDIAKKIKDWDITLINDMSAFIFTFLVKNKFKKMNIENYDIVTNKYISGLADIESMNPVKEILKLSKVVLENDILLDNLKQIKTDKDFYSYIENNTGDKNEKEFIKMLKKYINEFGDRNLEELKLESKTFRTTPTLLTNKIINYVENKDKIKIFEENLNNQEKVKIKTSVLLRFYIKKATDGIKNREISRLNRSRIYGMARSVFLKMGQNLFEENKIEKKEDIFYLFYEDIQSIMDNKFIDIKELVEKRKNEYEKYSNIPTYSRMVFAGEPFDKNILNINIHYNTNNSKILYGTPCSSGIIEGEVVVVKNPNEVTDVEGKILVSKMTDPGWVFLLTMSKGIISEKGSLLSHTAIISRELKVPSIVSVPNVTKILKTGDFVKLNGNTGEIEILKEAKNV